MSGSAVSNSTGCCPNVRSISGRHLKLWGNDYPSSGFRIRDEVPHARPLQMTYFLLVHSTLGGQSPSRLSKKQVSTWSSGSFVLARCQASPITGHLATDVARKTRGYVDAGDTSISGYLPIDNASDWIGIVRSLLQLWCSVLTGGYWFNADPRILLWNKDSLRLSNSTSWVNISAQWRCIYLRSVCRQWDAASSFIDEL